jgi:predicted PurR-regulated permease PerM
MRPAEAKPPLSSNRLERAHLGEDAEDAMPLPADPKAIFLGGVFFILLLAALYITAEIVWPLVLAFALSMLLNPLMRFMARLHVPRVLGALLLVIAVLGLVVALGTAVSTPQEHIQQWLHHIFNWSDAQRVVAKYINSDRK